MDKLLSRRIFNLSGFVICIALLGYAYYTQFFLGLEPCPLCIFQRIAVITLGVVFLAAGLHHPGRTGSRIYSLFIILAAAGGAGIAGRHVWLQHLPADQVPACGPGLSYMLDVFPLADAIKMAFTGSGECADVDWTFLGLSMPTWVVVWFVILGVSGFARNWWMETAPR
ncbi:MAG: disulfide bond formation protein B [Gammaproteobacteria bacterium]|nr:disulfide bond formation protein B [Gammaproteobacteria bacterium]